MNVIVEIILSLFIAWLLFFMIPSGRDDIILKDRNGAIYVAKHTFLSTYKLQTVNTNEFQLNW
jgi:hypothetical protein